MSDHRAIHRQALSEKKAVTSSAISLSPVPEGFIIQVLSSPGAPDIRPFLDGLTVGAPHAVRAVSPGQWFLVGDKPLSHEDMANLIEALAPRAAAVDQSHGRVRIRIEGPKIERVLAKGTGVDLSLPAFPVGHSTTTLIGHIAAQVSRIGADVFELVVLRGFAESLWDDLVLMSAEYTGDLH